MPSTDHRPGGVADDPIADALRAVPVTAPLDDWSATMARHRRHRRRQRLTAVGASVLALVLVVGVAAVVADGAGDDDALPVQAGEPTTVAPDGADAADVSGVTWAPIAEDPRLGLVPAGPYVDGQEVTFDGPQELFDPNDAPQLCATIDGREACDPLWSSSIPFDVMRGNASGAVVPLRRWVFTPWGWRDCGDPSVTCRIVQHGQDGANRATGRLAFVGDVGAPPELVVGDGGVVAGPPAELATTVLGPAGLGPAARITSDVPPPPVDGVQTQPWDASVSLCRFLPPPTAVGASILPSDCELLDTSPQGTGPIDASVPVPRSLYGFAGWHDCADGGCFVMVQRGTLGDDGFLLAGGTGAAGLVRFAPDVADRPRPTLEIEPAGPHTDQQVVTVTGAGFSPGAEVQLGQCNAGDPANGTNPWGQPWEDCRYAGPLSFPVDTEGGFTVEIPMIRYHTVLGMPGTGVDCAVEPAGTCYLGYTPGKGYAEPMVSVPLTFTP